MHRGLSSVIWRIIGFLLFLFIVLITNLIAQLLGNPTLLAIVGFINAHLGLILIIAIFFLIADIFWALGFPLDIPAPIFAAIGSVLLVRLAFLLLGFLDSLAQAGIGNILEIFALIAYVIVFFAVLIGGYIEIIARTTRRHERRKAL